MPDELEDLTPYDEGDVDSFLCEKRKAKDIKVMFEKEERHREDRVIAKTSIIDVWKEAAMELWNGALKIIRRGK